ncbi:unnamed protein product [Effrenium voratum]|nr:unnamed protein product [Effrenium voratum]
MQLFVREVTGASLSVAADGFDTVAALKERLALLQAVPADEQRLLFGGRSLSDAEVLAACGLEDESTVFLSMDLSGGGKKRKKKTYTKPKKIKHKRKKVRAGEAFCAQVLQGGLQRQGHPFASGVPARDLRQRGVHGYALQPLLLREVPPHLPHQEGGKVTQSRHGD